jgi:hypothetical protein
MLWALLDYKEDTMIEQDKNNLIDGQQEWELWPGRYYVSAEKKRWPHRGGVYRDVEILLFQPKMPVEELKALMESLGLSLELPGGSYIISQIEQTFTGQQADELIAYLEEHDGTKAWKEPAYKPIENGIGLGFYPVGGPTDFYKLHMEEGYNLSFKAEAYYDVEYAEWAETNQEIQLDDMAEQEEKLKRKIRMKVSSNIKTLSLEELDELQDWLDEKKAARVQAMIDEAIDSL